ncbi:ion channel [Plastoroseomonas hellenica]|uniref:ion channel n=1 Tax=Plastoroseomonas hellenica TaxID=2687306 RepID=UPI001BABA526|nr:ion channel [Plastoroseomonas hellenica]MBR0641367.1 hypothetical protein [Plastoroseomonas hellenica]
MATLELVGGMALAVVTLRDVFDTVVVPGGSRTSLRVAQRSVFLLLPVWKRIRARNDVSATFGPLMLVLSFVVWMVLLTLAFGMMAHALSDSFQPPLPSFSQAVFLAGSALVTIGLSETDALGVARWVVVAAGFCGLAVMTMAVTYLLEVQSSIAGRDAAILKMCSSAGDPPSALALLERHAAIGSGAELADVMKDGRDWCAQVQQSHTTHPSLVYFRSVGTGAGWPATLGALLDLALIVEHCLEIPELRGRAALLRQDGTRMAEALIDLLQIPKAAQAQPFDYAELRHRLVAAGYAVRPAADATNFPAHRAELSRLPAALADHLGKPSAPLILDRSH